MDKLEQTISELKYSDDGLIPAVCVDQESGKVVVSLWLDN